MSMFLVTLLSFGMEQVVVRRIAASNSSNWAAAAYLFHTFACSLITTLFLFVLGFFISDNSIYHFLPLFFAAQSLIFIATPLKQFLNAKEKFTPYAIIALISNGGKVLLLFTLLKCNALSVQSVSYIFIAFGLFELVALLVYVLSQRSLDFKLRFKFSAYGKLIKESFPQFLSVIFDSSLSRVDWILLGILSTKAATADYSFAYRAYELLKLPLVILGPVILVKYSKLMSGNGFTKQKSYETGRFLAIEIFISVIILLVANVCWSPLIDSLTKGKYGTSNSMIFLAISLCLPLQFAINLFWTVCFSAKKYRQIARITFVTAIINLALNIILIPRYGGMGAAGAYLVANLLQAVAYFNLTRRLEYNISMTALLVLPALGVCMYLLSVWITPIPALQLIIAIILFTAVSFILKQVQKKDVEILASYLKK